VARRTPQVQGAAVVTQALPRPSESGP
jgi:hypothetical protein